MEGECIVATKNNTTDLSDALNQTNSQDNSISDQQALRSIFEHALQSVLPEPALRTRNSDNH